MYIYIPIFYKIIVITEPGYYEEGQFGIRLENIVRVVKAQPTYKLKETKFLTFEDVTLIPIQTKMLTPELLTAKEVNELNIILFVIKYDYFIGILYMYFFSS